LKRASSWGRILCSTRPCFSVSLETVAS
jgi:hypothetical protein